jgi:hypothetical protein
MLYPGKRAYVEMCVKPAILLSTMELLYGLITGGTENFPPYLACLSACFSS